MLHSLKGQLQVRRDDRKWDHLWLTRVGEGSTKVK